MVPKAQLEHFAYILFTKCSTKCTQNLRSKDTKNTAIQLCCILLTPLKTHLVEMI